jgi:uncharacterized protein (TIGR02246 family)
MNTPLKRGRGRLIGALLVAVAAGVAALVGRGASQEPVRHHPAPHDASHEADEKAIGDNRAAYARAFEAGDASKAAALWSADGELVQPDGHIIRGRAAIEKDLASFFAENGPAKIHIDQDSMRFPGPDVALESGKCRVTLTRTGAGSAVAYSIVHVKKDGKWYLATVRESAGPAATAQRLEDLDWMVGSWSAKGGAIVVDLTCEWNEGKKSLVRRYKIKAADGAPRSGMQIIALDPSAGVIRGWTFDADGSIGLETWTRDGERWVVHANSDTKDGHQTASTNLLKRINGDTYSWRSVERTLDGVSLPDTPEVTVRRNK